MHLYDKVRQDLFEETQQTNLRTPSITTICLLQIQAYIIQILSTLPPIRDTRASSSYQRLIVSLRSVIRHCLRWILLVILLILDNIARILNVEREMADLVPSSTNTSRGERMVMEERRAIQDRRVMQECRAMQERIEDEDEDDHYRSSTDTYRDDFDLPNKPSSKTSDQCTKGNSSTNHGGSSEPSSPNKRSSGYYMVSPMNSPTPQIFIQPSRAIKNNDFSPVLGPSRVNAQRIRSSSFNTTDKPKILRRSPGQREITVQNGTLPILPKKSSHHHHSKKPPTANSIVSRSSSESSTGRPRMQKTMSLSTAQQYQHNNEVKN